MNTTEALKSLSLKAIEHYDEGDASPTSFTATDAEGIRIINHSGGAAVTFTFTFQDNTTFDAFTIPAGAEPFTLRFEKFLKSYTWVGVGGNFDVFLERGKNWAG